MKKKNLINKLLAVFLAVLCLFSFAACQAGGKDGKDNTPSNENEMYDGKLEFDHSMELTYAKKFSVDYYKGGYKLIKIEDNKDFLVVPENMSVPESVDKDTVIIKQPLDNIMVASTPSMSLINSIGALGKVSLTNFQADTWYINEVKEAMNSGTIGYAGDSMAPDYETIASKGTTFAIFSTMISEDMALKLEQLGVNYILDQSSNEDHPLARVEWAKLYGAIFNMEDAALAHFTEQEKYVKNIEAKANSGKNVVVFYISSKGEICARNSDDYMAKMVKLAGGNYVFDGKVGVGKTGNAKMDAEAFYDGAKDADIIIYIWSMGGKPATLKDFTDKNAILSDIKAVKEGNVWCTTPDFFQTSGTIGSMINDFNLVINSDGKTDKFTYLYKLK